MSERLIWVKLADGQSFDALPDWLRPVFRRVPTGLRPAVAPWANAFILDGAELHAALRQRTEVTVEFGNTPFSMTLTVTEVN